MPEIATPDDEPEDKKPTVKLEDLPTTPVGVVEEVFFGKTEVLQLDLRVRRYASYGALSVALVLYAFGLFAMLYFFGLLPVCPGRIPTDWHVYVTTVLALFSVPTVLVLAVLRSTGKGAPGGSDEQMHEAIGSRVMNLFDALIAKSKG